MEEFNVVAETRESRGKEAMKKLRREGKVPGVVYGAHHDTSALLLDRHDFDIVLQRGHGERVLVNLSYGDTKDSVFIHDVQRDPVSDKVLHVDFLRVHLGEELTTTVPVIHTGTPAGEKEGGVMNAPVREVELRCLPKNVPPHIEVNVEALGIGDAIHVGDLPEIEGVEYLTPEDTVLVQVGGKMAAIEAPVPEEEAIEESLEGEAQAEEGLEGEGEAEGEEKPEA